MLKGSLLELSREAEDRLKQSRSRLLATSHNMMMLQAIADLAEICSSSGSRSAEEYCDVLRKVKTFAEEVARLPEPVLFACEIYSRKKLITAWVPGNPSLVSINF